MCIRDSIVRDFKALKEKGSIAPWAVQLADIHAPFQIIDINFLFHDNTRPNFAIVLTKASVAASATLIKRSRKRMLPSRLDATSSQYLMTGPLSLKPGGLKPRSCS